MKKATYAAIAFVIWAVAAMIYLDVQNDMIERRIIDRTITAMEGAR